MEEMKGFTHRRQNLVAAIPSSCAAVQRAQHTGFGFRTNILRRLGPQQDNGDNMDQSGEGGEPESLNLKSTEEKGLLGTRKEC